MKLHKKKYILIFLLIASMSIAQSKKDSSWAFSAGVNTTWDYYNFFASKGFKFENRYCGSINGTVEATKYFGKNKIFGLGLEPHIGISQIAFNAIIPNTDFDDPADSMDYNNRVTFYRRGIELPEQIFNYRINYGVWGTNLHIKLKPIKWLETSFFIGFIQYQYMSKNFPAFNLAYKTYHLSGTSVLHTDILNYVENFWRGRGGIEVNINVSKQIKVNVISQMMIQNRHNLSERPYIQFTLTQGGDANGFYSYMNRCFSLGLGLKYTLTN